jgi:hypothetical protein
MSDFPESLLRQFPQLVYHLRQYCADQGCKAAHDYLSVAAAEMVRTRLRYKIKAVTAAEGGTDYQISRSVVAGLFQRTGPGTPLALALASCNGDDSHVVARFWAYVVRSAANDLFHRLGISDPAGYNLTRCLRDAYDSDPRIVVWPTDCPAYVTMANGSGVVKDGDRWEYSEIVSLAMQFAHLGRSTAPNWLWAVVSAACEVEGKAHIVEIGLLEAAFREANSRLLITELNSLPGHTILSISSRMDISRAIKQIRTEAHDRLDRVRHSGIVAADLDRLHRALDDLLDDLRDDGVESLSRYEYVKRHRDDLSQDQYQRHIKSVFQSAVEYVWQRLRDLLGPEGK